MLAVKVKSSIFGHFRKRFRSNRKCQKFSETEFVGVLGAASFGTNLKEVLVMDYTRTLLIITYMAIGAFPYFSVSITITVSTARNTALQDS